MNRSCSPASASGRTMIEALTVLSAFTTRTPGKARCTCSPRLSALATVRVGGMPGEKSSALATSTRTLPSRLTAPAAARTSSVTAPDVQLNTASPNAAASSKVPLAAPAPDRRRPRPPPSRCPAGGRPCTPRGPVRPAWRRWRSPPSPCRAPRTASPPPRPSSSTDAGQVVTGRGWPGDERPSHHVGHRGPARVRPGGPHWRRDRRARETPVHPRHPSPDVPGPPLDHAPVRRVRLGGDHQRPLPVPPGRRPDRAVVRLRPADPDGLRLRPPPGRGRGGQGRRRHRHARRHAPAARRPPARRG